MSRLRSLLCLLAIAGCNNAESPAHTHSITSVTWDAMHQPIVHSSGVAIRPFSVGTVDMAMAECDPSVGILLSDAPLVTGAGAPQLDPASNLVCVYNPDEQLSFQLADVPYPLGGGWAGHVRAFQSSTESGAFVGIGCQDDFGYYETANAAHCTQIADTIKWDAPNTPITPCVAGSASCSGNAVITCDEYGERHSQICATGTVCILGRCIPHFHGPGPLPGGQ